MLSIELLKKQKLFNPDADDSKSTIIGGSTTNLLYLAEAKYPWAKNLWQTLRSNFWGMEKINLTNDLATYKNLTEAESNAYNGILSYLIFLDSIQTNNIPTLGQYITNPEITMCLGEVTAQEILHSFSYQTVLESAVPPEVVDNIYYFWKDDEVLRERCEYIASLYQKNIDEPTIDNFIQTLMADLLLEGLYFWVGFYYFYGLSARGLMMGTADTIKLIQRDEQTHIYLFKNMLSDTFKLLPKGEVELYKNKFKKMADEAVEKEIAWWHHIVGNEILGFSKNSIAEFVKHKAYINIYKPFSLPCDFSDAKNTLKHLELIAGLDDNGSNKGNFFESTLGDYQHVQLSKEDAEW